MDNIIFKNFKKENLSKIMEIEQESFSKNTWESQEIYMERMEFFPKGTLEIWSKEELIGFISSEIWLYEKSYDKKRFMLSHNIKDYHTCFGTELYISSFAISKYFRGKKLGKEILSSFFKKMKENYKIDSCILLVSDEWISAKKTYENLGYNIIDKIESFFTNDYEKKFDGIIMRKKFD